MPWQVGILTSAVGLGEQGRKLSEIKLELFCWDRFAVSLLREAWSFSKDERGKKGERVSLQVCVVGLLFYYFLCLRPINTKQCESVGLCVPLKVVAKTWRHLSSIFTDNLVGDALRCASEHVVLCWVLFGSSKALRAPELKVIEREPMIWILLTGYFICMWGKSSTFPSSSQPFCRCNSTPLVLAF